MKINGEHRELAPMSVAELLQKEGYQMERVVVERNMEIVPKAEYATTILAPEDEIEVVSFVGGG